MATRPYSTPNVLFWIHAQQEIVGQRLGKTLGISLLFHLGLFVMVLVIRLPHNGERPLASVEISLVSLATPQRSVEAQVAKPVPTMSPPRPAPIPAPPKTEPVPLPVRSDAPGAKRVSGDIMRDVLKDIQLPPDAPKVGDLSPAHPIAQIQQPEVTKTERSPDKLRRDVDTLLSKLKVPPTDAPPVQPTPSKSLPTTPPRVSLSDELNQELDKELSKIQAPPVKHVKPVEDFPRPTPPVVAKAAPAKVPETTLRVPSSAAGSNQYLARVQQRISSFWEAPPIDISGSAYAVIIRFRLLRNGTVSGVSVERSSGNEYYDLAGKRAVLRAIPLPAFPTDITDAYYDAYFTFTIGEQAG